MELIIFLEYVILHRIGLPFFPKCTSEPVLSICINSKVLNKFIAI